MGELSLSSTDQLSTVISSPAFNASLFQLLSHQLLHLAPAAMKVRAISCPLARALTQSSSSS